MNTSASELHNAFWNKFKSSHPSANEWNWVRPHHAVIGSLSKNADLSAVTVLSPDDSRTIRCQVTIEGDHADSIFEQLQARANQIHLQLGFEMEWLEKEHARRRIDVHIPKCNDMEVQVDWPYQFTWLSETVPAIERVFRDELKAITVS